MASLFEPTTLKHSLERLDQLSSDSRPRWGRMDLSAMLSHNADVVSYALGRFPAEEVRSVMGRWPLNWLLIHVLPWPKGKAESPPEFLGRRAAPSAGLAELKALVQEFAQRGPDAVWPRSPAFGPISGKSWGVLMFKHLDHHLRQFGV